MWASYKCFFPNPGYCFMKQYYCRKSLLLVICRRFKIDDRT